jgi:hypothetical protein
MVGGVAAATVPRAGAFSTAARAFDRTVVCADDDGVVTVGSSPLTTHHQGAVVADDAGSMSAGGPTDPATLPFLGADTERGAFLNLKRCVATKIRVRLTRKGLPVPPVLFGTVARCPVSGRVLLRLRYTYVPGPHARGYAVGGRLVSAFLAARTYRTRKPLAFARLTANGNKSQLYSAASCTT